MMLVIMVILTLVSIQVNRHVVRHVQTVVILLIGITLIWRIAIASKNRCFFVSTYLS